MEEQIKQRLEELRVGLQNDGGDLELVRIEDKDIVFVDDDDKGLVCLGIHFQERTSQRIV